MTRDRLARIGWIAVACWVVLYAPMALEYMARFFGPGPQLWDHVYSGIAGSGQALGAGSIHAVQDQHYRQHAAVMVMHTTLGALAILVAVFQISARSRRRIVVHRWLGRVQVTLVVVAMSAAMAFLVAVGPSGTFDGPAFNAQLWALAVGTLIGTVLGWIAIRRRQVGPHRILMTYAFALLCTAPFLRLGYLVFGVVWPHGTQEVSNLAGAGILAFLAPSSGIVVARFVPAPRSPRLAARELSPVARAGFAALCVIGVAALGWQYAEHFSGLDRVSCCWWVAAAIVTLVSLRCRRAAADLSARRDWGVYLGCLQLAFPVTAALWAVFGAAWGVERGYYAALLTGPALAISVGVLVVAASRWRLRPAEAKSAVRAPVRATPDVATP
ncbi:DUF2306 domain-containing protein [Nocardioides montaniterrae]